MVRIIALFAIFGATTVLAHPGEHHSHEAILNERNELQTQAQHIQRGLDACAQHPKFLALKARGQARRAEKARLVRLKRGLTAPMKRDAAELDEYAALSHNSSSSGYTIDTDPTTLFAANKNASCVLTPKVTEGPYYVTGEYYRSDTVEDQSGVPLHMEYQYIDISTCDVAQGLYIEQWHANATGVYSGVEASGNGVGTADPSNLNNTFLRGVQATDSEGVAAFDTVFPGHYTGRAIHIHMMAHQNGTILSNGTFTSASVSSVGQVFFDQDLITTVDETQPYASNTQTLTLNVDDSIAASEADNFDPFAEYAYLGDSVTDGLLGWINVGIDLSASYTVSAGAAYYGTGGVEGTGSGGGSGGGSAPSGSMPSGGMPSGSMPSGGVPTGSAGMGPMPTSAGSSSSIQSSSVKSSTVKPSSVKSSSTKASSTKASSVKSSSVKASAKSSSAKSSSVHSTSKSCAKASTHKSTGAAAAPTGKTSAKSSAKSSFKTSTKHSTKHSSAKCSSAHAKAASTRKA